MDSSPNFRGASALLRGTSRTCGPKRGIRRDAPSVCLTGEGSATPPRRPHPDGAKCAFYLFFIQKFRPPFQRWRGRGAVRQRKFGFQPKLPGRKRPSSGDFSGFQPEARFARRPLSLPYGEGSATPPRRPHPDGAKCAFYLFFIQKFRPPFQRWRGRGAVRQRKFGFQPKLPGRKRPSSGDFSDLRSEARHPPRRPLSLPYGRGVGDPSPQAPPRWGKVRFLSILYPEVSSTFSKVAGSRGGAPDAARTRRNTYPMKRFFRVNCRDAARGGFLQEKKPPCTNKYGTGS